MHGGPGGTIIRMHALVRGDVVAFDRSGDGSKGMSAALAANWWAVALRGAFAILFGAAALAWPGGGLPLLVPAFAAYGLADGSFGIVAAMRGARRHQRWALLTVQGVLGIGVGAIALEWRPIEGHELVALIAAWSLASGSLSLISAVRLRASHGRDRLALAGVLAILSGGILLAAPLAGTVVEAWWIGVQAIMVGGALLMLGTRLRERAPMV